MQHANAPLTVQGRLRMVLLVEEGGFTLQAAAADACNVAEVNLLGVGAPLAARKRARACHAGLSEGPLLAATSKPESSAGR
jgi:hypothetical protein